MHARARRAGSYAIRLGMRLVKGLREEEAQRIVAAREERAFASMAEVVQRAELSPRATRALAMCGAFRGLTEHRNLAFWEALGVERARLPLAGAPADEAIARVAAAERMGRDSARLLSARSQHRATSAGAAAPAPAITRRAQAPRPGSDRQRQSTYASAGWSLICSTRRRRRASSSLRSRTRPASTTSFSGRACSKTERHNIIGTTLLVVHGELQNEKGVIHVVAQRVEDYSHWVDRLPRKSRDFH